MKVGVDSLYCPMAPLLWASAPGAPSPAGRIHKIYARTMWRERDLLGRAVLLARFAAWPVVVLGTLGHFLFHNGRTIQRQYGRGVLAQLVDQLVLATRHGILPPWCYMFELFRAENRARAGDFLHRYETKHALYGFLKRNLEEQPDPPQQLNDKALFAELCERAGVPTPPLVAVAEAGRVSNRRTAEAGAAGDIVLPQLDLFIKPLAGKGGKGTLRADYIGNGGYRTTDGVERSADEVIDYLRELSKECAYVVQQRLFNHHEIIDLCANALSCARILTIKNKTGGFEALHAAFRMAMRSESPVDGLHMGGLVYRIDIETGELGPATDLGLYARVGWCERHAHTGAEIAGRQLPMWAEVRALAERAHAAFSYRTTVGWDITITEDGPVVVEGNNSPCVDINQRVDGPIGSSRFGELLAFHLERAEQQALAAA